MAIGLTCLRRKNVFFIKTFHKNVLLYKLRFLFEKQHDKSYSLWFNFSIRLRKKWIHHLNPIHQQNLLIFQLFSQCCCQYSWLLVDPRRAKAYVSRLNNSSCVDMLITACYGHIFCPNEFHVKFCRIYLTWLCTMIFKRTK